MFMLRRRCDTAAGVLGGPRACRRGEVEEALGLRHPVAEVVLTPSYFGFSTWLKRTDPLWVTRLKRAPPPFIEAR